MILKKEKEISDYKPYGNVSPAFGQVFCSGNFLTQDLLGGLLNRLRRESVSDPVNVESILHELRTWAAK